MAYCCCCFKGPQTSICWPMWILLQWDCVWFRCESPTWEKCFHQLTGLWIWGLCTVIVGSHSENMSALQVHCQTASRVSCNLRVKSNTCYCCDLYNCGKYVCVSESHLDISLLEYFLQTGGSEKQQLCFVLPCLSSGLYLLVWCVLLSLKFSSVRKNVCVYLCFREHPLMGLQNKDVLKKFRKSSMIWK